MKTVPYLTFQIQTPAEFGTGSPRLVRTGGFECSAIGEWGLTTLKPSACEEEAYENFLILNYLSSAVSETEGVSVVDCLIPRRYCLTRTWSGLFNTLC